MTAERSSVRIITLQDERLPQVAVEVRRNRRSRHVRIHVDEGGTVIASIPQRLALKELDVIVRERAGWIHDALVRAYHTANATEVDLYRGDPVRVLGRWVPTVIETAGRPRCDFDGESITIGVPEDGDAYAALERWFRGHARTVITDRVRAWSQQLDVTVGALSIRDQRTRWGSCTHKGDLSFNWRLVMTPMWVLDAIVVHEITHIDELNHSERFWSILAQRYPRHDEAHSWLELHGATLRFRPAPRPDPSAAEHPPASSGSRRRGYANEQTIPLF